MMGRSLWSFLIERSTLFRLVVLLALLACSSIASLAQTTASIKGTVTDASGAVIASAKIVVKNSALGIERNVASNSEGYYEVPALPPGSYSVKSGCRDSSMPLQRT